MEGRVWLCIAANAAFSRAPKARRLEGFVMPILWISSLVGLFYETIDVLTYKHCFS